MITPGIIAAVGGESERERLRLTFEEVPQLYDLGRMPYPAALFDDLVALCELRPGSRVLEIGPATGRATEPLAARGLEIVGVELGDRLAAFARSRLALFPRVTIVNADFETWEPPQADFDAVTAFTALHWIAPDLRYAKPARLLRPGGRLAVVSTQHVLPEGGDRIWAEVQEDYDAVVPSDENRPPPRPEDVPDLRNEIAAVGLFEPPEVRRHIVSSRYTADEYLTVLDTYSGHRAMPEDARQRLYERIHKRITGRTGGTVELTLLATLNVARRR